MEYSEKRQSNGGQSDEVSMADFLKLLSLLSTPNSNPASRESGV
jgi:hypothetical protein